ncbi:MAG: hypothetical protein OXF61_12030 [Acidimicrobiaceae bacterium]|nr:hypothetical protein [Acidimicrobiaceae bacterium]
MSTDTETMAQPQRRNGFWQHRFWSYLLFAGVLAYFSFGRIDNRWLSLSGWQIGLILCAVTAVAIVCGRVKQRRREAGAVSRGARNSR